MRTLKFIALTSCLLFAVDAIAGKAHAQHDIYSQQAIPPAPASSCSNCQDGSCGQCTGKDHGLLYRLVHWCPFFRQLPSPPECKRCLSPSQVCRPPVYMFFANRYPTACAGCAREVGIPPMHPTQAAPMESIPMNAESMPGLQSTSYTPDEAPTQSTSTVHPNMIQLGDPRVP